MDFKAPFLDGVITVPDTTKIIWASEIYPVLVDSDDYEYLSKFKWSIKPSRLTYYAQASIKIGGERKLVRMHRLIMGFPKGMVVHHKNHHGWVNIKGNLEVITQLENSKDRLSSNTFPEFYRKPSRMNGRKLPCGIKKSKEDGLWVASHKGFVIGEYLDYENAVSAHDYYVCMKYGKKAQPIRQDEKGLILLELNSKGLIN